MISEIADTASCPQTVVRTYGITDLCGNAALCFQTITVNDTIPPTLTCPGDTTVLCDISELPAYGSYDEFASAGGNATDNCGINATTFTLLSEVSDGATCPANSDAYV